MSISILGILHANIMASYFTSNFEKPILIILLIKYSKWVYG